MIGSPRLGLIGLASSGRPSATVNLPFVKSRYRRTLSGAALDLS